MLHVPEHGPRRRWMEEAAKGAAQTGRRLAPADQGRVGQTAWIDASVTGQDVVQPDVMRPIAIRDGRPHR